MTPFALLLLALSSSARNCFLAVGSLGPAFIKFICPLTKRLASADVKLSSTLNAFAGNLNELAVRATLLTLVRSTSVAAVRDLVTARLEAIVCSMAGVATEPNVPLPD